MTDLRLAEVVSALVATRDRLQEKVGHASVAIEALGKLLDSDASGPGALAPATTSPEPASRKALPAAAAPASAAKVNGAPGPRTSERRRMPRADRPVEDEELDSLLERGKRGAA
jgi:hypothetical protein